MTQETYYVGWVSQALPDCLSYLSEPAAPSNYKDPVKIAAYVAEARLKQQEDVAKTPGLAVISEVCILNQTGDPLLDRTKSLSTTDILASLSGIRSWREGWEAWTRTGAVPGPQFVGFEVADFFSILAHQAMAAKLMVPARFLARSYPGFVDPHHLLLASEARKMLSIEGLVRRFQLPEKQLGHTPARVAATMAMNLMQFVDFR